MGEPLTITRCGTCGVFIPGKLTHGARIVSMPCAHHNDQEIRYVPEQVLRAAAELLSSLVAALESSRFALHAALMGYKHAGDEEGIEVTAEVLHQSQAALVAACTPEPPRPICRGCSPIAGIEDPDLVQRWRDAHPEGRKLGMLGR